MTAVFRTSRGGRVARELRQVAVPTFAIGAASPLSQEEGNSGSAAFTFPVTRAVRLDLAASVDWAVTGTGGDPANSADFNGAIGGTLSFAAGETLKTITVNAKGDLAAEADEAFLVTLSNPSAGTIAVATAAATIIDDDDVGAPPGSGSAFDFSQAANSGLIALMEDFSL